MLDQPQGGSRYLFLLLFHIEDNVHFKFGGRIQNFRKSHLWYLFICFSFLVLSNVLQI